MSSSSRNCYRKPPGAKGSCSEMTSARDDKTGVGAVRSAGDSSLMIPNGTAVGAYRIDGVLGQGGMGAVYLATHLGTERYVALKLIAPEFMRNEEFVERFKREARAAGRLRHPNVVDVTDFGFSGDGAQRVAYLVMEYLDGCTLSDVLHEESRLPLYWVVDILEQVCAAVHEAHQQGIVHRDLKPDNIWLEPNGLGGYRVKVLDFGIAKLGEAAPADLEFTPSARLGEEAATLIPASRPVRATVAAGAREVRPTIAAPIENLEAATLIQPDTDNEAKLHGPVAKYKLESCGQGPISGSLSGVAARKPVHTRIAEVCSRAGMYSCARASMRLRIE